MNRFRRWSVRLAVGLLMLGSGALADELQLVFVQPYHGNLNQPVYVRQPSGSREADLRGITAGVPIELYETRRTVVVRERCPMRGGCYRTQGPAMAAW